MAQSDFSEMLVAATLLQALAFALFLLTERLRRSLANKILCGALLLIAAVKADHLITIRHESADGVVEYSSYGHLKAGSVRVKAGDRVLQGDIIGEVGDTGDSAAVHLHFQINEGPDAFFSRSKPVTFRDITETFGGQDPGIFVRGPRQ